MSKKIKILIGILITSNLVFLFIYIFFKNPTTINESTKSTPLNSKLVNFEEKIKLPKQEKEYTKVILEINGIEYKTEVLNPTNVEQIMQKLASEGKITFKDKTYTSMGKFIEEINGIKNGEKNWIYYVNNKKANIGISNYQIKPGDVVSWKYESSY